MLIGLLYAIDVEENLERRLIMSDESLTCPRCGNTNIKQVGSFYQCSAIRANKNLKSCGYIAEKYMFSIQKRF